MDPPVYKMLEAAPGLERYLCNVMPGFYLSLTTIVSRNKTVKIFFVSYAIVDCSSYFAISL